MGASRTAASSPDLAIPLSIARAVASADRLFLKAPGATMIRMVIVISSSGKCCFPYYAASRNVCESAQACYSQHEWIQEALRLLSKKFIL
jgi:hypothetical protein